MPSVKIKSAFNMPAIEKKIKAFAEAKKQPFIELLKKALINYVETASNRKEYQNQTSALINSTGGRVYENGEMLFDYYPNNVPPRKGEPIEDGATKGRQLADFAANSSLDKGNLIVVVTAGMHYAVYLEAKGREVLTGTAPEIEQALKTALNGR